MPENINDKGYRRMLGKKRNFLKFIKQHIAAPWVEQLREEDIELVNSKFVTRNLKDRESDIIYRARVNGRDIYFFILLELQSSVNFTMPFRFLEYMVEMYCRLFYDTDEKTREQKAFRLPAIVPIVLYNGADEWTCVRSFKEYLAGYDMFMPNVIDFEYIMFNVNAPDEKELTGTPTLMNLAMLLDRKGDSKSFLRRMKTVRKIIRRLTPDEQTQLKDWILDVILKKVVGTVGKEAVEKIKKSFDEEDENEMTYAIERIIDDAVMQGETRKALDMARKMINDGIPVENASKYSGIPADELRHRIKASDVRHPAP
jgi:predicted transposase/invertase (TIGR01784 family)